LAELGALEGPLFLLAERKPGDAAIAAQLARVTDPRDDEAARHADSPAPPATAPGLAPADPARDALLNLIDTRLAHIADAARQATPKEPAPHAPT
ncbi:TPA: FUSC family protein, partial [Burkholderia cepacia]|nr:FUSC family protein [Burkholderia cepacia]